jgi:peptidoglycan/LPS O-acetylase OafA/YrhL
MVHHRSHSSAAEEELLLLDEKTLSDLESDEDEEKEIIFPTRARLSIIRPWLRSVRPSQIYSIILRLLWILLPSFVQSALSNERPKATTISPTAYLDGMRGLAALFVFFFHASYTCLVVTRGYGLGGDGQNRNILRLPIIRLLYSGPPMVCVFFVISGYALSFKPLKLMRSRSWDSLLGSISSSVFRRGFRLFLPTTVSTFLVVILLQLNMYERTRGLTNNKDLHRNVKEYHPMPMDTIGAELVTWIQHMFIFICPFDWTLFSGSTGYDVHLWTIPVELRASLMLFLTLVALARLRSCFRLLFLGGLTLFVFLKDRWDLALFFSGIFIAELDIIMQASSAIASISTSARSPSKLRPTLWILLAIVSLYLMSQPDELFDQTPGWRTLSKFIPGFFTQKYRFYQTLGSISLVLAVTRLPLLQKPFTGPVVQYFGKISYALYLMHGPIMHAVGYVVQGWCWDATGYETEGAHVFGFFLSMMFNVPAVIWAADVFWRCVDVPSVKFARWLEQKVIASGDDERQKELPR